MLVVVVSLVDHTVALLDEVHITGLGSLLDYSLFRCSEHGAKLVDKIFEEGLLSVLVYLLLDCKTKVGHQP